MVSYDILEHGQPLQARLREAPRPTGREVLVRITHCGVCHSDVHFWKGYFDLGGGKKARLADRGLKPPMTLGHEPLGMVDALGPAALGVEVGDKRLVYPWLGCGACWACEKGLTTLCVTPKAIGIALPGGFATHLLVPDAKYLVPTDGIEDAFASTLACSGVTSYSAVNKLLAHVHDGDWIAIIGCGGLGLLAIAILAGLGFQRIIACDVDEAKLDAAATQGAAKTYCSDQVASPATLAELAGGRLGGVIDFVGRTQTFDLSYPALRRGGAYVLVGLHGGDVQIPLPPIAQRGISILGSYVGTLDEMVAVVDLARSGKLRPTPVALRLPQDVNSALEELENNTSQARTVLDLATVQAE